MAVIHEVSSEQVSYISRNNTQKTERERKREDEKAKMIKAVGSTKNGIKKKFKVSAAKYMIRLAAASTISDVGGVIRTARAEEQTIKWSGASKLEMAKALSIIKRVIAKGNRKIACLKKEQYMESNQKIAQKNGRRKEEERLRKELQKRKKARRARELADTTDTEEVTLHSGEDSYRQHDDFDYDGLLQDMSPSLNGGVGIDATVGADAGVCCADAESLSVDVSV